MRTASVYVGERKAGLLKEIDAGYLFEYLEDYAHDEEAHPVSLTLPLTQTQHLSKTLHPFFDGLIPEGWLLEVGVSHWKADSKDRFGLLLAFCEDCIGNVSIKKHDDE